MSIKSISECQFHHRRHKCTGDADDGRKGVRKLRMMEDQKKTKFDLIKSFLSLVKEKENK